MLMQNSIKLKGQDVIMFCGMTAFLIIAFIKFSKVYMNFNYEKYSYIFSLSTIVIIIGIFFVLKCIFKKASFKTFTFIYTLVSSVMFVDRVYFAYNNKLTSIFNLKLIWQLKAVENSIESISPISFLWILADIPLIILMKVVLNKQIKEIKKESSYVLAGLLVIAIITASFYGYDNNFKLKYLKGDNIIYHISDLGSAIFKTNKTYDLSEYIVSYETRQDELYGIAKDRNVIIIQVEALQSFVLDQKYNNIEVTPFLNKLKENSSIYFNNYYYQVGGGNTSDAEFAVNNSILPVPNKSVYTDYYDNKFYGLPYLLKDNGYKTVNVFHGYKKEYWNREKAYVNQGFDRFYSMEDYSNSEMVGLGITDKLFFKESVQKMRFEEKPFYSFMITLTSHNPFYIGDKAQIEINEEHNETQFGFYIQAVNYVDSALETFFEEIKKSGLYDNSIFVIYGDHNAIPNYGDINDKLASEWLGYELSFKEMFNVPCIIHVPGMEKEKLVSTPMGHIDLLPTLLHLLGIQNDKSIMMGKDILCEQENIVPMLTHVGSGSFISKDIFYYRSGSEIDVLNNATKLLNGMKTTITNDMINQSKNSKEKVETAKYILDNNIIIKEKF